MIERTIKKCETFWCEIYLAGPMTQAEHVIRKFCFDNGFCVNIWPSKYIYTGGEESGYVVKIINYARFPTQKDNLISKSFQLADILLVETFQKSYSILTPEESTFVSIMDK